MAFDNVYCPICGLKVQRVFIGQKGKSTYSGIEWARLCKSIVPGKSMLAGQCDHLTKAISSPTRVR